jgi:hypothetical protein
MWPLPAIAAAILICACPGSVSAQDAAGEDSYDGSRQIKYNGFVKSRPAAAPQKNKAASAPVAGRVDSGAWYAATKPKPVVPSAPARTAPPRRTVAKTHRRPAPARVNNPEPPRPAAGALTDVGVTIWRLRPASASEDGPTLSFMTAEGLEQLVTPVRIKGTDPVRLGDRLRFSIESPRTGYLYVINRTQYDDGSIGTPELIYPTTRTRGGDNRVTAGRLIDIPSQEDTPNFYTLTSNGPAGKKTVGEILDIIVSPHPVPELSVIGREPLRLSEQLVAKWSNSWGDLAEQLELIDGEGKPWTQVERDASADGGRSLTQEEPSPQTIYRVRTNQSGAAMVTLQLLYGEPKGDKK